MDLIVDANLDDINSDLKDIDDEFQHAQDNADPGARVWGQRDVAHAMHDFAHNWYVHRGKIQDRLGKLSKRVDQSCAAWSDAEKQLASSIETTTEPTHA
jgi:hypothetical protein